MRRILRVLKQQRGSVPIIEFMVGAILLLMVVVAAMNFGSYDKRSSIALDTEQLLIQYVDRTGELPPDAQTQIVSSLQANGVKITNWQGMCTIDSAPTGSIPCFGYPVAMPGGTSYTIQLTLPSQLFMTGAMKALANVNSPTTVTVQKEGRVYDYPVKLNSSIG